MKRPTLKPRMRMRSSQPKYQTSTSALADTDMYGEKRRTYLVGVMARVRVSVMARARVRVGVGVGVRAGVKAGVTVRTMDRVRVRVLVVDVRRDDG